MTVIFDVGAKDRLLWNRLVKRQEHANTRESPEETRRATHVSC